MEYESDSNTDDSAESKDHSASDNSDDDDDDDEPADCKRLLSEVFEQLRSQGVDVEGLWTEIRRIVQLTMTAIHPEISLSYLTCFQNTSVNENLYTGACADKKGGQNKSMPNRLSASKSQNEFFEELWRASEALLSPAKNVGYNHCFQIIGFDIFLDHTCKPYILEINHNPSFKLPTELDVEIKSVALGGCLGIVCNCNMAEPLRDSIFRRGLIFSRNEDKSSGEGDQSKAASPSDQQMGGGKGQIVSSRSWFSSLVYECVGLPALDIQVLGSPCF